MFSDEQVFVWDVESLQAIAQNPNPRNLLAASAILRRLLMDMGEPLLNKVSRKVDIRPLFKVLSYQNDSGFRNFYDKMPVKASLTHFYINPDTSIYPSANTMQIDLGRFLALEVFNTSGTHIKIKDLIKYCSDVGGGVHQGKPRNKNNAQLIHDTSADLLMNGHPYPLECLRNIVNMSIEAMLPIFNRLRA